MFDEKLQRRRMEHALCRCLFWLTPEVSGRKIFALSRRLRQPEQRDMDVMNTLVDSTVPVTERQPQLLQAPRSGVVL